MIKLCSAASRFGLTRLATATRGALTLAAFLVLLVAVDPAKAQGGTVLYNFSGGSDGGDPGSGLTTDGAGNFYGTTYGGGLGYGLFGYGTVYELSPNGVGGWNETVLYTFTGGADGSKPSYSGVIFDKLGNLYGTTCCGGANGYGVVFELSRTGASWTETVLYNFTGSEEMSDPHGLIVDAAGNLYGTTQDGATGGAAVYELSPSTSGWTANVIRHKDDIGFAVAGLAMDAAGNIFGATASKVFELSPNGNGGWNLTVIHKFSGAPKDGSVAEGTPMIDTAGNVYGTTTTGGRSNNGTVYKLSRGSNGKWTETHYSFPGGAGGSDPFAGVVLDADGNIYGVTENGGNSGVGTVFELVAPMGAGRYKAKVLGSFDVTDGEQPYYPLILDNAGNLYGTASWGGSNGWGVVFEVSP